MFTPGQDIGKVWGIAMQQILLCLEQLPVAVALTHSAEAGNVLGAEEIAPFVDSIIPEALLCHFANPLEKDKTVADHCC